MSNFWVDFVYIFVFMNIFWSFLLIIIMLYMNFFFLYMNMLMFILNLRSLNIMVFMSFNKHLLFSWFMVLNFVSLDRNSLIVNLHVMIHFIFHNMSWMCWANLRNTSYFCYFFQFLPYFRYVHSFFVYYFSGFWNFGVNGSCWNSCIVLRNFFADMCSLLMLSLSCFGSSDRRSSHDWSSSSCFYFCSCANSLNWLCLLNQVYFMNIKVVISQFFH